MVQSTSHSIQFLAASPGADRLPTSPVRGTLSSSTVHLNSPPVLLADVSNRIASMIMAEGHGDASGEGVEDPVGKLIRERFELSLAAQRGAEEIMKAIVARGWITDTCIELFKTRCSSPSPFAVSCLGVLEHTLQIDAEREGLVASLNQKAASYGLHLSNELSNTMRRLDNEGSALFLEAVGKTKALLDSFEGPSCHQLARELLSLCIKPGDNSIKPDAVNDFLTQGRKVSRSCTDEFPPNSVFNTAIEQGWLQETDRHLVKRSIFKNPDKAWPIMHALKALRSELNHRSQIIRDLEKRGIQIPESINVLKDVVSRAASQQFVRLVNDLKSS